MKKEVSERAKLLKTSGSRVTPRRLALLQVLKKAGEPLSVENIVKRLGGRVDRVTVYRALEALRTVGVIRKIDLGHTHAHFELSEPERHHHHLVCTGCGKIEDVPECSAEDLEKRVLRTSKHFRTIEDHALEFFGICRACSR